MPTGEYFYNRLDEPQSNNYPGKCFMFNDSKKHRTSSWYYFGCKCHFDKTHFYSMSLWEFGTVYSDVTSALLAFVNPPDGFHKQKASNTEIISMWWRHHVHWQPHLHRDCRSVGGGRTSSELSGILSGKWLRTHWDRDKLAAILQTTF